MNTAGKYYVYENVPGDNRYWHESRHEWTRDAESATFYTDKADAERAASEAADTTTAECVVMQATKNLERKQREQATMPKTFAKLLREHAESSNSAIAKVNLHQFHDGRWAIFGNRDWRNYQKDSLKMICITDEQGNMKTWANASAAIAQAKQAALAAGLTHGTRAVHIELTIQTEELQ